MAPIDLRLTLLCAAAALASCATGPPRLSPAAFGDARAEPGRVVAAELAFARLALEKGQWTAFAETSTVDAVMFVPQAVNAHDWLKGRANPPATVTWQPAQVWVSCDGSLAVTKGPWQRLSGVGYFTTVWQRQRDGGYKWVMDQGDSLPQPLALPEMISGKVAECPARPGAPRRALRELPRATITPPACAGTQCTGGGASADGTLSYAYTVAPSGARAFSVQLRQDDAMHEVLRSEVAAP
ncbi:MAG: hypothetical protein ABIP41_06960 [Croceibacterium sp.]